jgi:hypothetical protein
MTPETIEQNLLAMQSVAYCAARADAISNDTIELDFDNVDQITAFLEQAGRLRLAKTTSYSRIWITNEKTGMRVNLLVVQALLAEKRRTIHSEAIERFVIQSRELIDATFN